MKYLPRSLLITLALLTVACSRTDLLYDNADWLAYRWADKLLDASGAQQDAWRDMFRQAMAEHRRELLPQLVQLLHGVEAGVGRGLTSGELRCWLGVADRVYREHARWAIAPASLVLADLSPPQVEHLAGQLSARNEEYRETYLDPDLAQRERRRVERYIERVERWTGDLTTAQLRLVEALVGRMPDTAAGWLDYRQHTQRALLALLGTGAKQQTLQRFLDAWWVDLAGRPPDLLDKTRRVRDGVIDLVVALDETITPRQRERVRERLRDLRVDLAGAADMPSVAAQTELACLEGG